nr:PA2778 family cysteine peptidase [Marinobacter confluentis]
MLAGTLVALFAGCASVPPWPETAGGDAGEPLVQLDVPFFPQERYQCGPAALATMLASQDIAVTADDLVPRVYLPEREGSLKVELVAAARQYGMLVYPLDRKLADIVAEVDAGHPVLVMQNLGFDWFPQWHFAVVVGYDPTEEDLILHTDTRRANRQPLSVFYRTWERAERWAAVILPPGDFPATAQALPYLEAASDLELTGQQAAAFAAYQASVSRWPDEPAPKLGMGNIAYSQERWTEAAGYYLETVASFPGLAPGWNNLAHALARSGCASQSAEALACANRLKPDTFASDLPTPPENSDFVCPTIQCPAID